MTCKLSRYLIAKGLRDGIETMTRAERISHREHIRECSECDSLLKRKIQRIIAGLNSELMSPQKLLEKARDDDPERFVRLIAESDALRQADAFADDPEAQL